MARPPRVLVALIRAAVAPGVVTALALASCGSDASGCSDFDPKSAPLPVGEVQDVEVETTDDGGWVTPDIGGGYWQAESRLPASATPGDPLTGRATRVDEGTIKIDFGDETVIFTGPIGCE